MPPTNRAPSPVVSAGLSDGWYVSDPGVAVYYPELVEGSGHLVLDDLADVIFGWCSGRWRGRTSGESWMYLLMASDPHRPMSCTASRLYPRRVRNWAPETRQTCSENLCICSPCGPGRWSAVPVDCMALRNI